MNLLDLITDEYISMVEILEENNEVINDRIIIDRVEFKEILEKYGYMTFTGKTKVYKALGFIIHDNNSYTCAYKDPDLKKTVRKVIINYKTYKTIKRLHETNVDI